MSRRITVAFLAAVLPLAAAAQQSQTLRDRDPELEGAKKIAADLEQANFRYGPIYFLSRLRIGEAGFSEGGYVPAGDSSGGLSLSIEAPQRLYLRPHRKTILSAEVVPGYSFFRQGERSRQFNYSARADAHFLFNHLYLDIYTSRSDQLRAHVADINSLATVREDETGVAGEVKYSSRTSGVFSLRIRDTEYPQDRFQPDLAPSLDFNPVTLLDRSERTVRGSMMHKTFPLTSLFASAELSDYSFRQATYKDSRRTWLGAGALYDAGRTEVRVEAGPMRLDFEDPSENDFTGMAGEIRATRASGRMSYHAAVERDVGFSIFAGNNYYLATMASAGAEYIATRRLTLRTNVAGERDVYETPVFGNERRDTMSFSSVGFSYLIWRVRTGADVGWYTRESTFGGDEDAGIRWLVHLSLTP